MQARITPRPTPRTVAALQLALAALLLPACSESSKSSSRILSSPSTSLSRSSSPEDAYRNDVRDFTAAHIQSGGTADGLIRELGELAKKHGITDWESHEATFYAVGEGLAKGGYRQVQVDAFKQNLTKTEEQAKWTQEGYDSAR